MIQWLTPTEFPPWRPQLADATGLVAVGGDLSPRRLLDAYRAGVFPWFESDEPICWWSPDPRAIFDLQTFHIPRRLERTIRNEKFQVTVNRDFAGVIRGCSVRADGTWICEKMIRAYEALHASGWAHSVEIWRDQELAGGLYGVAVGGLFAGESMFKRIRDASKIALAFTATRLRERGFTLFDIQFRTDHTARFGAIEIARAAYLRRLNDAIKLEVSFE